MSCREMYVLMSSYLDGLLDSARTRRLEQHVEECEDCQYKLDLMQEIPLALQTDRMLAPQPEFTALVMQRIVITTQLQTQGGVQTETREFRSTTTFRSSEAAQSQSDEVPSQNQMKLLAFPTSTAQTRPGPAVYALRFSAMAAALVLAFGIGIYTLQLGVTSQATVSVNESIGWFAATLTSAFQSPPEFLLGVVAALALAAALWLYFLRNNNEEASTPQSNFPSNRK